MGRNFARYWQQRAPEAPPTLYHLCWQHCAVLVLIRDIRHWTLMKIWVGTFLVRNAQARAKTELILTVKWKLDIQYGSVW